MRNVETKENSQRRLMNNNVVIKHSQGPLVPSQGLWIIFWAISYELLYRYWNPRWKKLITWQPDCTHDLSCHNSENWPQRNGNKLTRKLKLNCTENNQDDASQTTDDQFQDDGQSWLCCFCTEPPPLSIKALAPLIASGWGSRPLDRLPFSQLRPLVAGIWNEANLLFHQPGLFTGFWAASSWTLHTF